MFKDSKVFVIWKWKVLDTIVDQHSITNTDEEDEEAVTMIPETCISDDDEQDDEEEVIQSITLKCIGTSKEDRAVSRNATSSFTEEAKWYSS